MPISSDLSNNSIVTAELVRTVWENYIARVPTFLNAVTLHIQKVNNPGGAGVLQFIVPNYFCSTDTSDAFGFPEAYRAPRYFTTFEQVNWGAKNVRVFSYYVRQYDQALLMDNEEYKMNFIESVLIKLLLDFEQDFANKLQGMTLINDPPSPVPLPYFEFSPNLWPSILPILPRSDILSMQNASFETKARNWYLTSWNVVTNTSTQVPALGFIPSISELGGWTLETCSQYAKYLNLKNPQLACSPAVIQAICTEYAASSSTSSLIGERKYNAPGNAISNGLLNAYTLPSLQTFPDNIGWTQGIMFSIYNVNPDPDDPSVYNVELECVTSPAYIPSDGNLYISKYTPLILATKRYTPAMDVAYYSYNVPYNFELGQSATMNIIEDYVIDDGNFGYGSIITVRVPKAQLALPTLSRFPGNAIEKFPLINTVQLDTTIVTLPWKNHDFNVWGAAGTTRFTHTGPLVWHTSYLHSKDSTHVFAVKQHEVGGGIVTTEEEVADKVPFQLFEQGKALEGINQVTSQGIMAYGVIPQLGGQFLCWSSSTKGELE
jgi:hypothetical protein